MTEKKVSEADLAAYEDCPNQGSMLATWKVENLCFRCVLAPVCYVAMATGQLGESLIVVSRCRSFTPVDRPTV